MCQTIWRAPQWTRLPPYSRQWAWRIAACWYFIYFLFISFHINDKWSQRACSVLTLCIKMRNYRQKPCFSCSFLLCFSLSNIRKHLHIFFDHIWSICVCRYQLQYIILKAIFSKWVNVYFSSTQTRLHTFTHLL